MHFRKQLSMLFVGLFVSAGVCAASTQMNRGYVELGAGGGLIGHALESKYIHNNDTWGPAFNARVGGGVIADSNNSSRFIGVNAHLNAYEYCDANIAFGRHINDQTDFSFNIGADFSDRFIVPRMAFDLSFKATQHMSMVAEVAFDAFVAPSAWLSGRYTF